MSVSRRTVRNFVNTLKRLKKYRLMYIHQSSIGGSSCVTILNSKKISGYKFKDLDEPYIFVELLDKKGNVLANVDVPLNSDTFCEPKDGFFGFEWNNSGPGCFLYAQSDEMKGVGKESRHLCWGVLE